MRGSWHYTRGSDQDHPKKKEMQKGKMVVWGALQIVEKRREAKKRQGRKGKAHPSECRVPKNSKER